MDGWMKRHSCLEGGRGGRDKGGAGRTERRRDRGKLSSAGLAGPTPVPGTRVNTVPPGPLAASQVGPCAVLFGVPRTRHPLGSVGATVPHPA